MIKDLRAGIRADGIYLVKDCNSFVANSGATYLNIVLQDASGTIEAKKFDVFDKDVEIFKAGNFVEIEGDTNLYREKLQIIVRYGSILDKNKINISHFIPSAPENIEVMEKELFRFINSIKNNDCNRIVTALIERNIGEFLTHPAAVRNHHDFYSGLLHHTITMCKLAENIAQIYPLIDYDMLISGCILHDLGKIIELSGPIGCKYTVEGSLLGHLTIGMSMIKEVAKEFEIDSEVPVLLEHMIVSHHGKLEYGAAVLPQTLEAFVLSLIDDLDAKVNIITKALENTKEGQFSDRIFPLDNRSIYKPLK